MAKKTNTFTVKFRRKRKGRTNYRKRLRLLLSGKPRFVVRKSLNSITVQLAKYSKEGDNVLVTVNSGNLVKYGWKAGRGNLPSAYLTGLLAAKKARAKGLSEAVLDTGRYTSVKGSRIYAAVKGAVDAGLKIPCSDVMFPSEDRIKGKHIEEHWKKNKKNFAIHSAEKMMLDFDESKNKILKSA